MDYISLPCKLPIWHLHTVKECITLGQETNKTIGDRRGRQGDQGEGVDEGGGGGVGGLPMSRPRSV